MTLGSSAPALDIRNLQKFFGGLPATQDISLRVERGERRLLIGPNGAGKTTLFNQIAGDILPTAGSIYLFGRDVTRLQPHQRAHLGLSRTYQIITLFPHDTLEQNIAFALLGLMKARWNMMRPLAFYPDIRARALFALQQVGLEKQADRKVSELAYGEKRRVEIAMAMAQRPGLLLLDEPLAGLSGEERAAVKKLIAAIPRDTTIVLIEHDMATALDLAETVTLMHYGKVIVDGPRDAVIADPRTREVYLGH